MTSPQEGGGGLRKVTYGDRGRGFSMNYEVTSLI